MTFGGTCTNPPLPTNPLLFAPADSRSACRRTRSSLPSRTLPRDDYRHRQGKGGTSGIAVVEIYQRAVAHGSSFAVVCDRRILYPKCALSAVVADATRLLLLVTFRRTAASPEAARTIRWR